MPVDPLTFFITAFLPYPAIIVLINGLLYRLYKWAHKPKAAARFTIYPSTDSLSRALSRIACDIIFFPRLLREEKVLWVAAWIFHLSLIMTAIGHYKVFFSYIKIWEIYTNPATFQLASTIFDGATAGIMIASLLFLLCRRFLKFLRRLSDPEDYLIIILILAISMSGIYLRFISNVNLLELRRYFQSLIVFSPSNLPSDPIFLIHYALVMLLMICFPLGKMSHTIGAGLTSLLVRVGNK